MRLRDEIKKAIETGVMCECGALASYGIEGAADHIIALFREALLSDEAVEAAEVRYDDTWDDIRESITAALDAVTGEDDER